MLGYAAIDLSPLLAAFPSVTGWYNIINWVGRCRGQLKISIRPREALPSGGWAQRGDSGQEMLDETLPAPEYFPRQAPLTIVFIERISKHINAIITHFIL